jgi:hypothetical protein
METPFSELFPIVLAYSFLSILTIPSSSYKRKKLLKVIPHRSVGISIIGSALDSTPPQAGLRKTLERQPLIDPNREERLWKDDSARRHMTHKNFNKTAF